MPPRSPLAPETEPSLPPIPGVSLAARACGVRYQGRTDVCLIEFTPGTTIAGVLTRSLTASAPVDWCRPALTGGRGRAVLGHSGNAHAGTGKVGEATVGGGGAAA
ncbi:MAG: bifunctional ornithine acetyltransferase/N-acetylglutamate synthase, partial [Dongiales bacterium]